MLSNFDDLPMARKGETHNEADGQHDALNFLLLKARWWGSKY